MKESKKEVPKTPGKTLKEQSVPFGFETVPALDEDSQCPCLENTKHKEIWLIKVPAEFDPRSLTGKTVITNGIQDVSMNGSMGGETRFEIISKSISDSVSQSGSCKALLPSSQDASIWAAKTFVGNMSVVQSVSVPTQHSLSSPEPSRHRVQAADITCRWKPFGYKKPFSTKTTITQRARENESADDQKPTFGLKQKDRTSKRERKQEADRSEEKKKHMDKTTKNRQERDEKVDEADWKSRKIKVEKSSPQKELQVKAEKISPKGKKRSDKAAESNWAFIPLGGKVKTEIVTEQEGEQPKKKRKKEKRKQQEML